MVYGWMGAHRSHVETNWPIDQSINEATNILYTYALTHTKYKYKKKEKVFQLNLLPLSTNMQSFEYPYMSHLLVINISEPPNSPPT